MKLGWIHLIIILILMSTVSKAQIGNTTNTYDENGDLIAYRIYDQNDLIIYEKLWTNGVVVRESHYKNNYLEGVQKIYDEESGSMIRYAEYKEDKLHGTYIEWYDQAKGWKKEEAQYENGQISGSYAFYHNNGKLKETGYVDSQGYDGHRIMYNEQGSVVEDISYFKGELDGEVNEYFDNGQLRYQRHYVRGKQHGLSTQYNEEGDLISQDCYLDNTRQDALEPCTGTIGKPYTIEEKYADGELLSSTEYLNGKLHGPYVHYYNSGKVKEVGSFEEGKLTGEQKHYLEDGTLIKHLFYSEGKLDQQQNYYFESGEKRAEQTYESGFLIFEKDYYQNGQLKNVRERKDGFVYHSMYWDNGNLSWSGKFKLLGLDIVNIEDFPDGEELHYYYTGELHERVHWAEGLLEGTYEVYDKDPGNYVVLNFSKGVKTAMKTYLDGKLISEEAYYPDGSIKK